MNSDMVSKSHVWLPIANMSLRSMHTCMQSHDSTMGFQEQLMDQEELLLVYTVDVYTPNNPGG